MGAVRGVGKDTLLSADYTPVPGLWNREPLVPEIAEIAAGSFLEREPPEVRGTGYVVRSLEAALWAFERTDSFRDAVLAAANLGDDADTTAAVCGQIAGAYYGVGAIPAEWLEKLAMRERIEELAEGLFARSGLPTFPEG